MFSLVFQNAGYEDFLSFDSEIEEFADNLIYYANEKNPFDEEDYGDSKNLLLKTILQKYKELYPEKSCQELYDTYGKEIAESKILSQKEKRSRYLWEIVKVRQLEKKRQKEDRKEKKEMQEKSAYPAAAGFYMLLGGCIAVIAIKNRAEKRQKNF